MQRHLGIGSPQPSNICTMMAARNLPGPTFATSGYSSTSQEIRHILEARDIVFGSSLPDDDL